MGDSRKVQVRLSKPEQQQLDDLLSGGLQPVRTVLRALVLRQLADGQAIRKVARNVGLTPKTVWLTSQRYQQGGLEGALYERARPGKPRLDAQQRQRIVALLQSLDRHSTKLVRIPSLSSPRHLQFLSLQSVPFPSVSK